MSSEVNCAVENRVNDSGDQQSSSPAPVSSPTVNQQATSSPKDTRVDYKASAFCNIKNTTVEVDEIYNYAGPSHRQTLHKMLKDGDITKDDYVHMYGRLLRGDKEAFNSINEKSCCNLKPTEGGTFRAKKVVNQNGKMSIETGKTLASGRSWIHMI
ncbi:hypothetical protein BDQ17DRAFT_1333337 [Cyathus striatus]|nr:hypothetical protein BDQ17DRAFT_1333337 [Cyathus striatus]